MISNLTKISFKTKQKKRQSFDIWVVVQKKLLKCVYLLSTWTKHKVLFRRKFLVCEVDSISLVSFCVYNFYFIWWPIKLLLPSSSTKFGTCLSVQCLLLSLNKETAKRREIIISEKKINFLTDMANFILWNNNLRRLDFQFGIVKLFLLVIVFNSNIVVSVRRYNGFARFQRGDQV